MKIILRFIAIGGAVLLIIAPSILFGQEALQAGQDTTSRVEPESRSFFDIRWTERKVIGVIFSAVVPGSGQTYLGHPTKGALLTLGTLGSALVAGLSENNVIGRNERLDELKAAYAVTVRYDEADALWRKMVETKEILDRNRRQRDRFLIISAGLWVANMVDVLLFTDDTGEGSFGSLTATPVDLAIVPNLQNGVNAVVSVRF